MAIIQDKYNIKFDFENQDLNIPIDDSIFKKYELNHKAFVANYVSIAGGQLFDAKKTTYKFKEGEFYLTVHFEQVRIGLLFIPDKGVYTDDYLEKLRIYCDFKKIRLVIVRLYADYESDMPHPVDANTLEMNVSGKDKLDVLDEKIKNLMSELLNLYTNKYISSRKHEIYESMNKELCYRLGILLSIQPKQVPIDPKIVHGHEEIAV